MIDTSSNTTPRRVGRSHRVRPLSILVILLVWLMAATVVAIPPAEAQVSTVTDPAIAQQVSDDAFGAVSYTHLTLPTTPYV